MFKRNAGYDKVLSDWKADPSKSKASLCKKYKASYAYLMTYQKNLAAAVAAGEATDTKIVVRTAGSKVIREAVARVTPKPPAKAPEPVKGPIKEITIKIPANEAVESFRKHKVIIIHPDRILNALGPEEYEKFCAMLGLQQVEDAKKHPTRKSEETELNK